MRQAHSILKQASKHGRHRNSQSFSAACVESSRVVPSGIPPVGCDAFSFFTGVPDLVGAASAVVSNPRKKENRRERTEL